MIYFLTKRKDHGAYIYKSAKITVSDDLNHLKTMMKNLVLGWDTEGSGARYHISETLLIQIGNKQNQIVIDFTDVDNGVWRNQVVQAWNESITNTHLVIGHNLKYDCNMVTRYGFKVPDVFDTLVGAQRINLGTGLLNNLKDEYERRLKKFFPEDKAIRSEFVGMSTKGIFDIRHIMYAAADIGDIIEIATLQKQDLTDRNQAWYVRNVEFPLVKLLSEIELEGLDINKEKWRDTIKKKQQEKFNLEKEMDDIISKLGKGNMYLTGGKFSNKRVRAQVIQNDLFGGDPVIQENKNTHNINYNSPSLLLDIVEKLDLPKPTFISRNQEKDSMSEEAIMTYLMNYPTTPLKSFLEKLLKYKGLQKFISSYGDAFVQSSVYKNNKYVPGFLNPITGRVHTVLKQCFTTTGRLSSGDKGSGTFNIQNLPAEKEIREAFELSNIDRLLGYFFTTCDLSGAELVIMAALANDQHLYELGVIKDDIHSPVATKCWRAVYQYRKAKQIASLKTDTTFANYTDEEIWDWIKSYQPEGLEIQDTKGVKYTLTEDFLVDKKTNKQLRTDFKPMIFGVFYGLMAKKGSETLNIPKDEAQVVIDVIRREFPVTIKMLEAAVREAFRYGYVTFNNRSNNRRSFSPVLELLSKINTSKYSDDAIISYVKENLDFMTQVEITGEALNCRIQGTQADMIKEAMVEIRKHPDYETSKCKILLSVHDEIGAKHIGKEFGKTIKLIMMETANKYLANYSKNIRMKAECNWDKKEEEQVLYSWTK